MHRSLNCSHSSKVPRHQQFDLGKPPNKLEPKHFASGEFENPVVNPPKTINPPHIICRLH